MVLQKRLDYGSSGYQVPAMPQVPRFAKGKRSIRRRVEANPMCAFDLLATVAGKLLETRNSSAPLDSVKHEQLEKGKTIDCDKRAELKNSLGTIPEKCRIDRRSPDSMDYCKSKTEECIKTPLRAERRMPRKEVDGNALAMCGLEDPMNMDFKLPALVSSDSSVGIPPSIPKLREHMEDDVDRDDDENSSGCTHPRAEPSKAFRPQRIGDRRVRKLLASKYWKVAPSMLKDGEFSDTEMKPVYRGRKMCYTRQRTQRCSFKRRKIFEHCKVSASDGGVISEGTSNSPVNGSIKLEAIDAELQGASGASSSSTGQNSSYESGDLHVKFSIKSFKVPELFIEIPENATVGSLKRTVMEAVTAILEGGLRVGVLLQGKKVRDDSKTLIQAGISHEINKMENLGFTLEPNPSRTPPSPTTPENFLPPCISPEQLTRIPAVVPPSGQSNATLQPLLTPVANCLESDHDSVHSPADVSSLDKTTSNSKALVPVPSMSIDALTVVPLRKSRRSELAQRRIRRPFSVAEVEALVQAVEKLGTGRWRDVKLRAFDNAKHRTYVDLKDKWKTLVHTARISPQQRRGEPVPQELLDRVLAAHAYWFQQQAKLQLKPPPVEACLLF